jgi:hypothetical protein
MHLPHLPRHIRRRKCNIQSSSNALPVHRIHVIHPHGHPSALVARFVPILLKRSRVRPFPTPALRPMTEKNLHLPGPHGPESRRRPPIPQLLPPPLRKPSKARTYIGHIQYRRKALSIHSAQHIIVEAPTIGGSLGFSRGERRFQAGASVAFRVKNPSRKTSLIKPKQRSKVPRILRTKHRRHSQDSTPELAWS